MTSPAGSIGVGVSIDASDLASEITRAVTNALGPALNSAEGDADALQQALNSISARAIQQAAQATDQLGQSADSAAQSQDRVARSSQGISQNLNRIDASALTRIVRGAEDAEQELAQLDRWQLQNLIQEANRAGQSIGQDVAAGASHAERELRALDAAGLERLIRQAQEAQRALRDTGDEAEGAEQDTNQLGEALGGLAGKAAGAAVGLAGIGSIMGTISETIERSNIASKIGVQLDLTKDEAAKAAQLTGDVYAQGLGESFAQVSDAVGAVQSTIGRLGEDSDADFKKMTASALAMADAFEVDVAESTQTANNLIRNGLAKDGPEAMDLLTAAMQRVPAAVREEIFPVMDEYSTYFQSIGFSGQEAMGIVVNAAQGGAIAMDKAGDAIKEFGIRATDLGDQGAMDAIKSIGLDSTQMANDLLKGGDTAQAAFDKIVNGLLQIDDPAAQAQAAVALFGTPLEDLDKAKIPGFLKGLANGKDAMGDFSGSAQDMVDQLNSGPAAAMEKVKRGIENTFVGALGKASQFIVNNKELTIALASVIAGLGAAFLAVKGAMAIYNTYLQATVIKTKLLEVWTNRAVIAQKAMAAVKFLANPYVLAIAAIVGALTLFFTKTETGRKIWASFMEFLKKAWETIKRVVLDAWNNSIKPALEEFWGYIQENLIPVIMDLWQNTIVPAFKQIAAAVMDAWTNGIQPALMSIWKFISEVLVPIIVWFVKNIVVPYWKLLAETIAWVWSNVIGPALKLFADFLTNVLAPALTWFWQNVITPVFNAIATVISAWWNNWVKPVWDAFVWVLQNVLAPLLVWLWQTIIVPVFNAIATVISAWWNNFVKPVWDAFVWVLQNVLAPLFTWLWQTIIVPALNGIGQVISFAWNNVIKPIWDAFVWLLQNVLAPVFGWLWNNIVKPAMDGIGAVISFAWNNVIKPVIDFMLGGWRSIGEVLSGVWNNIIKPIWDGLGNLIKTVWENVISPAFEAIKTALGKVGDFFSSTVRGITTVWEGLKSILAKPINFLINTVYNNGIKKAWDTVARFLPGLSPAGAIDPIPEHHTGGRINGPKGKDNVLMWGEAGEHMLTVQEVLRAGGHNLVYAMRDMINKGIPFTWANGRIMPTETNAPGFDPRSKAIQELGRAVQLGQPDMAPQGLFAAFRPRGYDRGGEILPWMLQLEKGHKFAKAMSGTPYIAGSNYPTGGDCSGFMSAIANVILGGSGMGGAGHWSTVAFPAGQASTVNAAGQVWVAGLAGNTMSIGMNGGPASGGQNGHTRGTLGSIPDLGYPAVNVESGGGTGGGATYGGPAQGAAGMPTAYHIPIGPNGFFEGGTGGSGPSPEEQRGFLEKKVLGIFDKLLKPAHDAINGVVGKPPPDWKQIPHSYLKKAPEIAVDAAKKVIGGLGDKLAGAWTKAKDIGGDIVGGIAHAANPLNWFDNGGIARGVGYMPKNVIAPERVLDPRQTELFETLVSSLSAISRRASSGQPTGLGTVGLQNAVSAGFIKAAGFLGFSAPDYTRQGGDGGDTMAAANKLDATGRMISDTRALIDRTATSQEASDQARFDQQQAVLSQVAGQLADKVFAPMVQTGVSSAMQAATKDGTMNALGTAVGQVAGQIISASVASSNAASAASLTGMAGGGIAGINGSGVLYGPGTGTSDSILGLDRRTGLATTWVSRGEGVVPEWIMNRIPNLIPRLKAMVPRMATGGTAGSTANNTVGADLLGLGSGPLATIVNLLVRVLLEVIGVQIQVRDTLTDMAKDVRQFRGDFAAFDASGRLTSDTSGLIDRSASSDELVINEKLRILKQIIVGLVKFVVEKVIVPMVQALFSGLISAATSAIGGAIGTAIGGPAGTAVGGVVGSIVGAGLSGLASIATAAIGSVISAGAEALLDGVFGLFDDGGVASGVGLMPKAVIAPERVLSPQMTQSFDRLVNAIAGGTVNPYGGKQVTIHAPFTVEGGERGGREARDRLLELMS
ncbi:tape measure protein [Gordonia phage NHagos]|nr:tape measure protein [Gordonia phage NHagos]